MLMIRLKENPRTFYNENQSRKSDAITQDHGERKLNSCGRETFESVPFND